MVRVVVPLAPGFEDLEAITVVDILRRAQINVTTAGLEAGPVTGSRGTTVVPDAALADIHATPFDAIVLPGGLPGADHLNADTRIHTLLRDIHHAGGLVAAICAAPKVLASASLLTHRRATCFPGSSTHWASETITLTGEAVTTDGNIITGRGPGTALDFALALVAHLTDAATRDKVESGLAR